MKGNVLSRIMTGLFIIGIGVVFFLQQSGYITLSIGEIISTFWPVILIWVGLKQVLAGESGGGWWGIIVLVVGGIFLTRNMEWLDWSTQDVFRYVFPTIIILVGIRMMFRPRKPTYQKPDEDEWQYYRPYKEPVEDDVPPAPPLHPDPTKTSYEFDEKFEKSDEQKNEQQETKNKHDQYYEQSKDYYKREGYRDPSEMQYDDGGYNKENYRHYKEQFKNYRKEFKRNKHVYKDGWGYNSRTENRSGFIGDIHIGHDYWELKPMNISHFIGDTVLDLTRANVPETETRINISSFIGDVKVYVPNDYEIAVQVVSSAFIGDVKILGRREGGLFTNVNMESPAYREAEKKIKIVVSTFIGDVRVTKVG